MTLKKANQYISIVLFSLSLQGCGWFYRPDIQQGNIITDMQIAQLRQGMTVHDVKKLLGTPVLTQIEEGELEIDEKTPLLKSDSNTFSEDDEKDITQMNYIYIYQPSYGKPSRKRIYLVFEDKKLIEFKILN